MHNISVAQAKAMFLDSMKLSSSVNTLQTYGKALESFLNVLVAHQIDVVSFPVIQLTENSLLDFIDYTKNFSSATESLYLQVIKSFFEFLVAHNLTTINHARMRMLIRQRTRRPKHSTNQYPEDDIKILIGFMSNPPNIGTFNGDATDALYLRNLRDRALILTLADTGLRVDEICILRRGDVDWDRGRVILKGRGNKQAVVRISTRAINAIKDYLTIREPFDLEVGQSLSSLPLFARHDKGAGKKIKPITSTTTRNIVAEWVHRILGADAVGSITPHTFLHYFVTTILQATGNLKLAQVLARHSNIQVTQKYAHINENELNRDYYEIFERKTKQEN